jgi:hypothetical protein
MIDGIGGADLQLPNLASVRQRTANCNWRELCPARVIAGNSEDLSGSSESITFTYCGAADLILVRHDHVSY